jgi:hypothetical protein
MITFFNSLHALHQGKLEMFRGELVPCFEVPARADPVLEGFAQQAGSANAASVSLLSPKLEYLGGQQSLG